MNPIQILPSHLLKRRLNIIILSAFWLFKLTVFFRFSYQNFVCTSLPCMLRDENMNVRIPWNVNFFESVCRNCDRTSWRTQTFPITKTILLIFNRTKIDLCSEDRTGYVNTLWGQSAECLQCQEWCCAHNCSALNLIFSMLNYLNYGWIRMTEQPRLYGEFVVQYDCLT
jgi:hypothetical protein